MQFKSDNTGPVHPAAMAALAEANTGYDRSYGDDQLMDEVRDQIRTLFEAPEAAVYLVTTGTAANALALSCYAQPWDTIFCTPEAHISVDECNAPEFYSGGSKLTLVGEGPNMSPADLLAAMNRFNTGDVHMAQPGPVSITQVTEYGTLYALDDLKALSEIAHANGAAFHLDGARFANACAALNCSPAEMSWKAGVDVVSFGGTKNGLMGVEAVILFDPAKAREFELRRKRAGHLMSKHRYLSAQMAAYLRDDLWLDLAKASNDAAQKLEEGLRASGVGEFLYPRQANMIFVSLPRAVHQRLRNKGAYYELRGPIDGPLDEPILARLVCDWSMDDAKINAFVGSLTP